jgi:mycothiol synthase
MDDITLRKFEWTDLESVAQLFTEIGGTAGTEKEAGTELVRQTLSHPSVRPETNLTLAHSGADLVGYYQLFPEVPISRAVVAGGVLEQHRGLGIGRQLLSAAMEQVEALDVSVLHIQTSSDAADARHMLESEGFEQAKDYWQMRWTGGDLPELNLRSNFSLKPFRLGKDEAMLTELQNAAFGQHWGFCPNTVEETAARVRIANTDPDGIIFVMDGDRPAGYNWTLRNENRFGKVGFVSMTGVHPEYRGNGLGTAVVVTGMEYLRQQGVDAIELEVDSENTPARELYLKLGYRQVHHSVWFERRF